MPIRRLTGGISKKSIFMFKAGIIGLLIGTALFFAPFGIPFFIFPVLFFILLSRLVFFRRSAFRGRGPLGYHGDYERAMPIDGYHDSRKNGRGGEQRSYSIH